MGRQIPIYTFYSYTDARHFWLDTYCKLAVVNVSTHAYWVTDWKEAKRLAKKGYEILQRAELLI